MLASALPLIAGLSLIAMPAQIVTSPADSAIQTSAVASHHPTHSAQITAGADKKPGHHGKKHKMHHHKKHHHNDKK